MNLGRERINKLKEQNKNPKDYLEKIREEFTTNWKNK